MSETGNQWGLDWHQRLSEVYTAINRVEMFEPGSTQFENYFAGYAELAIRSLRQIRGLRAEDERFIQLIDELEDFVLHPLQPQGNTDLQENAMSAATARTHVQEIETILEG